MAKSPGIKFNSKEGKFLYDDGVLQSLMSMYPGIDLLAELSRMEAWLRQHPNRKGTAAFVSNWLARCQQGPIVPREHDYPIDKLIVPHVNTYLGKLWKNRERVLSRNTLYH